MKQTVSTPNAPAAIGPYSQAVRAGQTVYLSGQLGIDPSTGEFAANDAAGQAAQAFLNIGAILKEAGLGYENIVKTTAFLADMSDFVKINEIYVKFFQNPFPARSAVAVKTLPKNALVEIEAIAVAD
jgi:2-iminobutanoate/2-iminopropanoate deaminase